MTKNKYNIKYLPSFDDELNEILYYISNKLKNKIAAEKLLENISGAIINRSINLSECVEYKSVKNRKYKWYKIYVKNYIVIYTLRNNTMEVAHIFYRKRNIEELI